MEFLIQTSKKITEVVLFSFLFILPLAFDGINPKWNGLLTASAVAILLLVLTGKIKSVNPKILGIIYAILFLLLFDFAEQVNFIHQFKIPVEITRRVPLSTVLLVIGMLALSIKTLIDGKVKVINHPFSRYFLFACAFLVVLMIIFYPFLYHHYQIQPDPNIQLLNKVFKYLMIFLLLSDYLSDEKRFKKMSIGLIFSMSLAVILSVVL